jgi:hypothetical protein
VIDLERLDASLDLALSEEVRVHRSLATTPAPSYAASPEVATPEAATPEAGTPPASVPRAPSPPRHRPSPQPAGARSSPLAPADIVWQDLDIAQHAQAVVNLVSQGRLAEADLHIAAHGDLAGATGRSTHRADAVGWRVMRALLDGREDAARAGVEELNALDPEGRDPESQERLWAQRLAVALTWGSEDERFDVLDHCRRRAYTQGDVAWRGRLTVLLAVLGRTDEAARDFDATIASVTTGTGGEALLDVVTDLAEAAWVLGDAARSRLAGQRLARAVTAPVVVVGRAWVCKGSVDFYRALTAVAAGHVDDADRWFRSAAEAHRHLGADALLARTLRGWATSLTGRDPQRSVQLLRQGTELAHRLGLVDEEPVARSVVAQAS